MNKPLLYSGCFCRLIILISFNFRSVVRVVFGKINFTALLCREFNLLLRTWLHPSHTTDAYSMWGLMWALKNSFLVSMSTVYLNFDRRKTRLETVLHTLLICESQRSLLCVVIPKRRCFDTWSIFAPFRTRSGKGDNWCFCLVAIVTDWSWSDWWPYDYYHTNWISDLSRLAYCFWFAYLFQMCAVLCHLPACHNQQIYLSHVMESHW